MARVNACQFDRMAGDDFTKYPLGAFNPVGPYDGPKNQDLFNTPIGTFTIVAGLESPAKNVLKAACANPSATGPLNGFYWVNAEPTIKQPNLPYPNVPQWIRVRFRCPPTLFSTTAVPIFNGSKEIGLLNASSAKFSLNVKHQVYTVTIVAHQNNVTNAFGLRISTVQQETNFGWVDPAGATPVITADCLASNFYQDDAWHDIILYWNGVGNDLIWKVWVDSNPIAVASVDNTYRFPTSVFPMSPRDSLIYSSIIDIFPQSNGQASIPAQDFIYYSMWEVLDAIKYPNPYNVVIDPVVTSFNVYQALNSDGSFQFYDENGIPVIIRFIASAGQVLPQVKFVDFGTPSDVIPRINSGDWIDIDIDPAGSLIHRFRYGTDPTGPQTILVDIRKGSPSLISINRNKSNPKIHTSAGNNWSLRSDRKNKDLNPLGYLVGNNRPTTTLTKGEKRLTNGN